MCNQGVSRKAVEVTRHNRWKEEESGAALNRVSKSLCGRAATKLALN